MDTNDLQDAFIENNLTDQGALSPAQAAALLESVASGDTSGLGPLDTGSAPTNPPVAGTEVATPPASPATPETPPAPVSSPASAADTTGKVEGEGKGGEPAPAPELNADNAVILAKDGKHTIGYEKLVEARENAAGWKAKAEAAQTQLAALQADAASRVAAGQAPTQTDNQVAAVQAAIDKGVNPEIFGDFSEEALAKGIQSLVEQVVSDRVAATVNQALAPIQKKQAETAAETHFRTIFEKHPDADSLVESQEFSGWIAKQPSYVQAAAKDVLEKGSAAQVVELFDQFKEATKAVAPPPPSDTGKPAEDVKELAKKAVAQAKAPVPSSLSDVPGGRSAPPQTLDELMENMAPAEMLAFMQGKGMSSDQINAYLDRIS